MEGRTRGTLRSLRRQCLFPVNLTAGLCNVHIKQMATRTISVKEEAYSRLRAARRYSSESFSEVVLRATWPEDTVTAGAFLKLIRSRGPRLSSDEVDRIEDAKRNDTPPEDKWTAR